MRFTVRGIKNRMTRFLSLTLSICLLFVLLVSSFPPSFASGGDELRDIKGQRKSPRFRLKLQARIAHQDPCRTSVLTNMKRRLILLAICKPVQVQSQVNSNTSATLYGKGKIIEAEVGIEID